MTEPRLRPVMLGGTGSDVGKSVLAAGLCRIFRREGYRPAPFKAQNMALNSFPTPDGLEIGRAQAVQAEAAGIAPEADMNPLLLKPSGERTSQVVLLGKPIGNRDAYSYYRSEGRDELRKVVCDSFDRLATRFNPIVIEGAGSIAEINLRDTDLVNIPMARHAGAAVILVADIDRGGVFASAYGSIMLQSPADRALIKGIIINKFRGDIRLFESGRRQMEQICGVPVLGVVPWMPDIIIDQEDSVSLDRLGSDGPVSDGRVNIAAIRLPYISNFTDLNALARDPRVNLYLTDSSDLVRRADIVLLPGSKSTIADLRMLRSLGLDTAIRSVWENGGKVVGICGGYQMLGLSVADPEGVETGGSESGLGLLAVTTRLTSSKVTRPLRFSARVGEKTGGGEGYEIHMGVTEPQEDSKMTVFTLSEGGEGLGYADVTGRVLGTYIHGVFDSVSVIDLLLGSHLPENQRSPKQFREDMYNLLADRLYQHIDIQRLISTLKQHD